MVSGESAIALMNQPGLGRTVNPSPTEAVSADDRRFTVQETLGAKAASVSPTDFDGAVEAFRNALRTYVTGDPKPVLELFSRREDVTLANPLGPPHRGPAEVDEAGAAAAAHLRDGSIRGFEEVSRYSTADLGYVVQIERAQARLAGADDMSPIALRVTLIFRREGDTWRVVHRHADPITTPRPITTTIESQAG
jgi:ketosteroid isomerase-like protein